MKKSSTTNPVLKGLIDDLIQASLKKQTPIWRELAKRLSRSRSGRAQVNVSRIARFTKKGDMVAIPGKLLGSGVITHPVTVAAFTFSDSAKTKITGAGGECIELLDMVAKAPEGTNVRIME